MAVTEFEYQRALKKLEFHQAEADKYRKITQQYFYEWDSVRVQQRKEDSAKKIVKSFISSIQK